MLNVFDNKKNNEFFSEVIKSIEKSSNNNIEVVTSSIIEWLENVPFEFNDDIAVAVISFYDLSYELKKLKTSLDLINFVHRLGILNEIKSNDVPEIKLSKGVFLNKFDDLYIKAINLQFGEHGIEIRNGFVISVLELKERLESYGINCEFSKVSGNRVVNPRSLMLYIPLSLLEDGKIKLLERKL